MVDAFSKVLNSAEMNECGLRSKFKISSSIKGELLFEKPVSISNAQLSATNSLGYLSYLREGAVIKNTHIGRYCSIAPNLFSGAGQHPVDWFSSHPFTYDGSKIFKNYGEYLSIAKKNKLPSKPKNKSVIIGNDVWIGEGVFISPGVKIGSGAVIGARSVVTKNVEPYMIVAGVPAKEIRARFSDDLIEKFLKLQWWNYDISGLVNVTDYSDAEYVMNEISDQISSGNLKKISCKKYKLKNGMVSRFI